MERQSATPPAENETDQSNNAVIPRRQQRVDFRLPPAAPRDSNENNLAGRFEEFGAASWTDERGFMTNDKTRRRLIEEDSLEEVNETDVSDEGEAAIKMKNGNDIAGKRQMTREEERLKDHPASRRNNLPPPVLERGRDGEEDDVGSLRGSDGASSRYGPRHRQQQQHPQRPREVDEEGNVWTTDEAGRRWIVDQAGRQWRLGLDERQYMIDVEGVKWTVEEVDGRRRRWRRNAKVSKCYSRTSAKRLYFDAPLINILLMDAHAILTSIFPSHSSNDTVFQNYGIKISHLILHIIWKKVEIRRFGDFLSSAKKGFFPFFS